MLRAPVLQTGELRVGGRSVDRVPGPAADAEDALAAGGDELAGRLAALGVGWVLVEAVLIDGAPGFPTVPLPGLALAADTPELRLYRVPGEIAPLPGRPSSAQRGGAWAAHLAWLATLVGGPPPRRAARRAAGGHGRAGAPATSSRGGPRPLCGPYCTRVPVIHHLN
ncbi:hypothetical protein [Tsukamurella sp. PLM1]|uniref:hypothetical protein n=1 Tax=Tsukamurella sp. PLM1 TaxID=2929795 RepID=UPI0020BED67B|nr:hypothetical protein [Tsukamurella sp. PLM1]